MNRFVAVAAIAALAACSAPGDDETVFDDQLETLDRARAVQDTVDEHAADLERRLEQDDDPDKPQ